MCAHVKGQIRAHHYAILYCIYELVVHYQF